MKAPFILYDKGDISIFESMETLTRYVESPDLINYRVFDSDGLEIPLKSTGDCVDRSPWRLISIDPVAVESTEVLVDSSNDLVAILREYLKLLEPDKNVSILSLHALISMVRGRIGFTS
jgi:hypothetical protein